jgi:hypothetical protein
MATAELVLPIFADILPALMSGNCTPDELRDETFLTEQITYLWTVRECHATAISKDRKSMRSVDKSLGQLLYAMKTLLVKRGRNGGWSSWLPEKGIALSSADRLANRFAKSISIKSPQGAISEEPTEVEIGKLVADVWHRIEKMMTTPQALYRFFCCLAGGTGLTCQHSREGVMIFDPAHPHHPLPGYQAESSPHASTMESGEQDDDVFFPLPIRRRMKNPT